MPLLHDFLQLKVACDICSWLCRACRFGWVLGGKRRRFRGAEGMEEGKEQGGSAVHLAGGGWASGFSFLLSICCDDSTASIWTPERSLEKSLQSGWWSRHINHPGHCSLLSWGHLESELSQAVAVSRLCSGRWRERSPLDFLAHSRYPCSCPTWHFYSWFRAETDIMSASRFVRITEPLSPME